MHSPNIKSAAEISPDGHWLAYHSSESGRLEIYVRPFPNVDRGKWLVSTSGGSGPVWSRNGAELFYLDSERFLTGLSIRTSPTFTAGTPARVFSTRYFFFGTLSPAYDVAPDSRRFLIIKSVGHEKSGPANIVVVEHSVEELKARVPTK